LAEQQVFWLGYCMVVYGFFCLVFCVAGLFIWGGLGCLGLRFCAGVWRWKMADACEWAMLVPELHWKITNISGTI
jgi:hypothetical protein